MSFAKWSLAGLLVLSLTGALQAQSIDDLEKKLIDAHSKVKSYTSKTKTTQNFDMGGGNTMTSDYSGTIEWKRDGDKTKFRTEMKGATTQNMGGTENKMDVSVLMVSDGDVVYTLSEQMGQKMATKQKPDAAMAGDPKKLFEKVKDENTLKVLPEETVDGRSAVVLEVTPKTPDQSPLAKSLMYFDKETGINIKVVGKDKDGKEVFVNTVSDIKTNVNIPDDKFKFTAPEGVQVMDMTGSMP